MEDQRAMTSMRVFREFLKRTKNENGEDVVDATRIVSRECYDLWVSTRKTLPPNPEKAFQRSLSAHVTGVDGRVPFTAAEEEAVLKVLRKKERWPCFEASSTRFGLMGFRAKGFHEKNVGESGVKKKTKIDYQDDIEEDEIDDEEQDSPKSSKQQVPAPQLSNLAHLTTTIQHPMMQHHFIQRIPQPQQHPLPSSLSPTFVGTSQVPILPQFVPAGEGTFLETAKKLLDQFSTSGMDAWSTILSLARMVLVSKGWKPPMQEDAIRKMDEFNRRFPNAPTIIVDITARKLADRVMLLSKTAEHYLGPIARDQKGLDHRLIPLNEAYTALQAIVSAIKNPGSEVVVNLTIATLEGPRLCNCFLYAFVDERLLVFRAQPA